MEYQKKTERIVIKTDGTIYEIPEGLEAAQKAVGGSIEAVWTEDMAAYVNSRGYMQNLPYNDVASDLFEMDLYGDVVVLNDSM